MRVWGLGCRAKGVGLRLKRLRFNVLGLKAVGHGDHPRGVLLSFLSTEGFIGTIQSTTRVSSHPNLGGEVAKFERHKTVMMIVRRHVDL